MKTFFKNISYLFIAIAIMSCSSDDDKEILTGEGDLSVFFDTAVGNDQLILGSSFTNSNNETLQISRFNFIVSNFVLIDENDVAFVYPKSESYFIVNEQSGLKEIHLHDIPAGNYKAVKFGIGVDQSQFIAGQASQQAFWDAAAENFLTWSWSVGYKFINFEGTFTSTEISTPTEFKVHMGSHGTNLDNYREVTLNLPTIARVRTNEEPTIHLVADANSLLDGASKLKLSDAINSGGWAQIMVNAEKSPIIANNAQNGMFSVDHVHNSHSEH